MAAGDRKPDLSAFQLDRFTDDEIPVPDGSSATELRAFSDHGC
jgi:hypothetical protein